MSEEDVFEQVFENVSKRLAEKDRKKLRFQSPVDLRKMAVKKRGSDVLVILEVTDPAPVITALGKLMATQGLKSRECGEDERIERVGQFRSKSGLLPGVTLIEWVLPVTLLPAVARLEEVAFIHPAVVEMHNE